MRCESVQLSAAQRGGELQCTDATTTELQQHAPTNYVLLSFFSLPTVLHHMHVELCW